MRKLRAIWQILFADKWAVFTFENAPEDPEWLTAPYFKWNISHKDLYFIDLIKQRIQIIIESEANNE
ncbi:MAG: hypothetical protein ACI4TD_03005 [Phocaeicola sp.]